MSARCVVCNYWIINGKCACNSDVGRVGVLPSAVSESARWVRRGVLPASAMVGRYGIASTCWHRCWVCLGPGCCGGCS